MGTWSREDMAPRNPEFGMTERSTSNSGAFTAGETSLNTDWKRHGGRGDVLDLKM
jgi:hypothetical protein